MMTLQSKIEEYGRRCFALGQAVAIKQAAGDTPNLFNPIAEQIAAAKMLEEIHKDMRNGTMWKRAFRFFSHGHHKLG